MLLNALIYSKIYVCCEMIFNQLYFHEAAEYSLPQLMWFLIGFVHKGQCGDCCSPLLSRVCFTMIYFLFKMSEDWEEGVV